MSAGEAMNITLLKWIQILTSKTARQSGPSSLPLPAKFRQCEFSFWPNFASANFKALSCDKSAKRNFASMDAKFFASHVGRGRLSQER